MRFWVSCMSFCSHSETDHSDVTSQDAFSHCMAVDTATQACTVSIAHGDRLLIESTNVSHETHSRHLMRMIENALTAARLELSDLDGFVVTRGPGSFTGLRIGVSVVKGLAQATGKPFVGVSYLRCLALQAGVTNGLVCAVIDARRSECYYALYRFANTEIDVVVPEKVGCLMQMVDQIKEPCLFIGNGVTPYRNKLEKALGDLSLFAPCFQNILRGYTQIWEGRRQLIQGISDPLETSVPTYIRKSDAQINLEEKQSKQSS